MFFEMQLKTHHNDSGIQRVIDSMIINTHYIVFMHAGKHKSGISIKFHLVNGIELESYSFNELSDCIFISGLIASLDLIEVRFINGKISFSTVTETKFRN